MPLIFALIMYSFPAFALITAPTLDAADELGFQVVGKITFSPYSVRSDPNEIRQSSEHLNHLCPGSRQELTPNAWRILLLSWSDQEFPSPGQKAVSRKSRELARDRGLEVRRMLRSEMNPELSRGTQIIVVNMATRVPQLIAPAKQFRDETPVTQNIKTLLARNGAAPSNPYQLGLFGEYSQRDKVLIWVDCTTPTVRARPRPLAQLQVAGI